jgi:hypothetical protein
MSIHDRFILYTPAQVERIAQNYFQIKSGLYGFTKVPNDRHIFNTEESTQHFLPMQEPRHARPVIDGKAKAQNSLELHCAVMDFEIALEKLPDRDLELLYKYHVFATHTLEELCVERGISSRGSMSDLLTRIVKRLTRIMNNEHT